MVTRRKGANHGAELEGVFCLHDRSIGHLRKKPRRPGRFGYGLLQSGFAGGGAQDGHIRVTEGFPLPTHTCLVSTVMSHERQGRLDSIRGACILAISRWLQWIACDARGSATKSLPVGPDRRRRACLTRRKENVVLRGRKLKLARRRRRRRCIGELEERHKQRLVSISPIFFYGEEISWCCR